MSTQLIIPQSSDQAWTLAAQFRVPCVPIPQPRQRHRLMTVGGRTMATNYTPTADPVNAYKAAVSFAAYDRNRPEPLAGPLRVSVTFVFDRPAYLMKPKSPEGRVLYAKKPDSDNLVKSTFDALNKILWLDDSQVCELTARKYFRARNEQPHVTVTVWGMAAVRTGALVTREVGE